jgi:GDP-4-dehydro-6-deoxy-D-mannose reductase
VRVLVTGAAGFVGRYLVRRLRARGDAVLPFDRNLDVTRAAEVQAAFARERPEAVVHLAALSSVAASLARPLDAYRVNYLGTCAVLAAARRHVPGARVLLVGSAECYGPARPGDPPFDERAPLRPASPYARAKAAADRLGACYAEQGLAVVRARPFPHTGPGQSDAFAASSFARQIAEIELGRRPPRLAVGALDSLRDYLDVEDVVEAYLRLLDPRLPPAAYNVASGVGVPLRRMLELLRAQSPARLEVEVDPARLRPADASVGSAARLERASGWRPAVPLEVTLGRLLEDWRARLRGG